MNVRIIDGTYTQKNNLTYVVLFGRSAKGEKLIHTEQIDPDFYVLDKHLDKIGQDDNKIQEIIPGYTSIFDEPVSKIVTYYPKDVGYFNKMYSHLNLYQSHVKYTYKAMIEKKIKYLVNEKWKPTTGELPPARRWYLDIETGGTKVPSWRSPIHPIYMIGTYDELTNKGITWFYYPKATDKFEKSKHFRMSKYIDINKHIPDEIVKELEKRREFEIRVFPSEYEMLDDFLDYAHRASYDYIHGWNASEGKFYGQADVEPGFDIPYIVSRCRELDLNYKKLSLINRVSQRSGRVRIYGTQLMDIMFWKIDNDTSREAAGLDDVSGDLFKIGKLPLPEYDTFLDIIEWNVNKALAYNFIDVLLTMLVDKRLNLFDKYYDRFVKESGVFLSDTLFKSTVYHMYLLRNEKKILPSKHYGRYHKNYDKTGGKVLDTAPGIYNDQYVAIIDFSQEYPSMVMMLNIGVTSKLKRLGIKPKWGEYYIAPNGVKYRKTPKSILHKYYKHFTDERKKLKKVMRNVGYKYGIDSFEYDQADKDQFNYKVWVNLQSGVVGLESFPLFDEDSYNSITASGRFGIYMAVNIAEEVLGYKVIAGDTDSIMVLLKSHTERMAIKEGHIIADFITMYFDKWIPKIFQGAKNMYHMECEEVDSSFMISEKKKQYIRRAIWRKGQKVNEIKMKGHKGIKYDTSEFAKQIWDELCIKLLDNESRSDILSYMRRVLEDHRKRPLVEIACPKSINKQWFNYESDTAALRAAKYSNKYLNTKYDGKCTPKIIWIKESPHNTNIVAVEEDTVLDSNYKIDWRKMEELNIWGLCEDWLKMKGISRMQIEKGIKGVKDGTQF